MMDRRRQRASLALFERLETLAVIALVVIAIGSGAGFIEAALGAGITLLVLSAVRSLR